MTTRIEATRCHSMQMQSHTGVFFRELLEARRRLILQYLQKADYRVNRAAAEAEVEETTFRRWMRFHGIRVARRFAFALAAK